MVRGGHVVGKVFDRTVEQLDGDEQQNDANQREALPGERRNEEGERNAERKRDQLLAERGFGSSRGLQPAPRIQRRTPQAPYGCPHATRASLQSRCRLQGPRLACSFGLEQFGQQESEL